MHPDARAIYFFCNQRDVNDATRHYLQLLRMGCERAGLRYLGLGNDESLARQASDLLTINIPFAHRAMSSFPSTRIHHWFQGLESVERAYIHGGIKGWAQGLIFRRVEHRLLLRARSLIFVSEAMREHYASRASFQARAHVLPCYTHTQLPFAGTDNRYAVPNLAYAGSLHRWQCVPDMLEVFKCLRASKPDARLTLYTREVQAARALCERASLGAEVAVTEASFEALPSLLQRHAYGLLLRESMLINEVSTPTKFSTYLAAGLIPVLTGHTPALNALNVSPSHLIRVPEPHAHQAIANAILAHLDRPPAPKAVHEDFAGVFTQTFNDERQIALLTRHFTESAC